MNTKSGNPVSGFDGTRLADFFSRLPQVSGLDQVCVLPRSRVLSELNDAIVAVPDWVGGAGLAVFPTGAGDYCYALCCEPRAPRAGDVGPVFAIHGGAGRDLTGQAILDLPRGMWSIRTVDHASGKTVALETARGSPIVCGLFSPGGPVVLLLRRVSD